LPHYADKLILARPLNSLKIGLGTILDSAENFIHSTFNNSLFHYFLTNSLSSGQNGFLERETKWMWKSNQT
jgi:hypothetical protein